jgi:hypothetical protein
VPDSQSYLLDPLRRRHKARKIRAMVRMENPKRSMVEACEIQKVSRTQGYRLWEELHGWEKATPLADQLREIEHMFRVNGVDPADPLKWLFASGDVIMAHVRGDDAALTATPIEPAKDPMCD